MGTHYSQKGGQQSPTFLPMYCGQTARWIKTPLGMEVGLGPYHTVLDGDPAPSQNGHAPNFWPMSMAKRSPISATAEHLFYLIMEPRLYYRTKPVRGDVNGRALLIRMTFILHCMPTQLSWLQFGRHNSAMIIDRRKFITKWSLYTVGVNLKWFFWSVRFVEETSQFLWRRTRVDGTAHNADGHNATQAGSDDRLFSHVICPSWQKVEM